MAFYTGQMLTASGQGSIATVRRRVVHGVGVSVRRMRKHKDRLYVTEALMKEAAEFRACDEEQ